MNKKLTAFCASSGRTASLALDTLVKDIASQVKDKTYFRIKYLPKLIEYSKAMLEPANVTNPTESDVVMTVHILSELQSRQAYLDVRMLSGLYDEDYNTRIKLIHAMNRENEILSAQMAYVYENTPSEGLSQAVETVTPIGKAKAS